MQETEEMRVRSLGWEDSLKESMATPVFLAGESHGQRSLAGYSPWGRKELDTLKRLSTLAFYWIKINQLFIWHPLCSFLVAQMVKDLPAMQETWIWSLGWKDPLEKEMATHSSILAWRIPWTEEPDRLQFMKLQSWTWLSTHTQPIRQFPTREGEIQLYWRLLNSLQEKGTWRCKCSTSCC